MVANALLYSLAYNTDNALNVTLDYASHVLIHFSNTLSVCSV